MIKRENLRIRDPYVVAHEGTYYMYGTINEDKNDKNLYVFCSKNLEDWEEGKVIFTLAPDSWAETDLWAPEVHLYEEKFYMFISIKGKNGLRGTQILVSDTPDGRFIPLKNAPQTPHDKSCIDGTLYVENGTPYMVFSSDWPDNFEKDKGCYVGKISAIELTKDLKDSVGEAFLLFESDEAPCSKKAPAVHEYLGETVTRYGSDAPFIQKLSNGNLFLTWSPIPDMNYIVAAAISENGIKGEWKHLDKEIFDKNGGHAMFFTDFEGKRKMCIHHPERYPDERALFIDVIEENGEIKIK